MCEFERKSSGAQQGNCHCAVNARGMIKFCEEVRASGLLVYAVACSWRTAAAAASPASMTTLSSSQRSELTLAVRGIWLLMCVFTATYATTRRRADHKLSLSTTTCAAPQVPFCTFYSLDAA